MKGTRPALALASALVVACTAPGRAKPSDEAISPTRSSSPTPSQPLALIELLPLSPQGVIVQRKGGVAFVALDGRIIGTIRGVVLANPTEAPGPVLFRRSHAWYVLDISLSVLRRISRIRADDLRASDDQAIKLPTPPEMTIHGQPAGHWLFALLSADGNRILAQWSGESEIPVAFLFTLQAGSPVPITGSAESQDIPESFALGWTRGGRAVILLPKGAQATGSEIPGIYTIDASGKATLISTLPTTGPGLARMWGSN